MEASPQASSFSQTGQGIPAVFKNIQFYKILKAPYFIRVLYNSTSLGFNVRQNLFHNILLIELQFFPIYDSVFNLMIVTYSRNMWPILTLYVPRIVTVYINKPTRCTFCIYLFYNLYTTLHVSNDHFIHHQKLINLLYLQLCTNRANVPNCSVLRLELFFCSVCCYRLPLYLCSKALEFSACTFYFTRLLRYTYRVPTVRPSS